MAVVRVDLAIIGGGVAGRSAARIARALGIDLLVLDASDEIEPATVWGIWDRTLGVVRNGEAETVEAGAIIVASGSRHRTRVFLGWTIPGVESLDDALEAEKPPSGRVLVAGTGPDLLPAATRLHEAGAQLVGVLEAAAMPRLNARDRAWLRRSSVPYRPGQVIIEASGADRVNEVVTGAIDRDGVVVAGSRTTLEVDAVVTSFGRAPASELARLAGSRHDWAESGGSGGYLPARDEWLRATSPGVIVCGDSARPGSAISASAEGQLGAVTAALDLGRIDLTEAERLATRIRRRLARARRVDDLRDRSFRLGPAVWRLSRPDALLCPCEGVTVGDARAALADELADGLDDPNVFKIRTRAGMGLCGARRCGEHLTRLVAEHAGRPIGEVNPLSVRPPIVPIPIGMLVSLHGPKGDRSRRTD